jgi:hypothetical protein
MILKMEPAIKVITLDTDIQKEMLAEIAAAVPGIEVEEDYFDGDEGFKATEQRHSEPAMLKTFLDSQEAILAGLEEWVKESKINTITDFSINVTTERPVCFNCTMLFNAVLPNLGKLTKELKKFLDSMESDDQPIDPKAKAQGVAGDFGGKAGAADDKTKTSVEHAPPAAEGPKGGKKPVQGAQGGDMADQAKKGGLTHPTEEKFE